MLPKASQDPPKSLPKPIKYPIFLPCRLNVDYMTIYEPPWPPKTFQNPSQIHPKSPKKRCPKTHAFSRRLYIDFSRFSTSKSMLFCIHVPCGFQASAKSAKPQKYQFRLGKIDIFKGFAKNARLHFASIFPSKNIPKTLPKRGLNH